MSELETEEVRQNLIGDALRRRMWIPIVFAVVLALAGYAYASTRPLTYTSTVQVLVRPLVGNPLAPDTGVSSQQVTSAMETEAQVVDSEAVAALAAPSLKQPWVPGSGTVKASVPTNTQIVAIEFTASSPSAAQAGAQATAAAYLKDRAAVAQQAQTERLAILQKQENSAKASLNKAVKAGTGPNASPEAAQQVQLLANQLVTIQNSMSTLQATGGNPGALVARATYPSSPNQPSAILIALIAGLLGLLLGGGIAIWLERRDTRVRGTRRTVAGVPVLTTMASSRGRSAGAEAARQFVERLRTVTLVALPPRAVVAVSAVRPKTAATPVAFDLAVALAEAGYRVSLVSTDPADSFLADLSDQARGGLAAVLGTQASAHDHLVEVDGVRVLPAGRDLAVATPKLASPRFHVLLDELKADSDYVVLAAAPASNAVGTAVAVAASGLILVGTDGATTRDEVEAARVGVDQLNVRILGLALVTGGRVRRTEPTPAAQDAASPQPPARPASEQPAQNDGTPTGSSVR